MKEDFNELIKWLILKVEQFIRKNCYIYYRNIFINSNNYYNF